MTSRSLPVDCIDDEYEARDGPLPIRNSIRRRSYQWHGLVAEAGFDRGTAALALAIQHNLKRSGVLGISDTVTTEG
jgi:hypothetical protein